MEALEGGIPFWTTKLDDRKKINKEATRIGNHGRMITLRPAATPKALSDFMPHDALSFDPILNKENGESSSKFTKEGKRVQSVKGRQSVKFKARQPVQGEKSVEAKMSAKCTGNISIEKQYNQGCNRATDLNNSVENFAAIYINGSMNLFTYRQCHSLINNLKFAQGSTHVHQIQDTEPNRKIIKQAGCYLLGVSRHGIQFKWKNTKSVECHAAADCCVIWGLQATEDSSNKGSIQHGTVHIGYPIVWASLSRTLVGLMETSEAITLEPVLQDIVPWNALLHQLKKPSCGQVPTTKQCKELSDTQHSELMAVPDWKVNTKSQLEEVVHTKEGLGMRLQAHLRSKFKTKKNHVLPVKPVTGSVLGTCRQDTLLQVYASKSDEYNVVAKTGGLGVHWKWVTNDDPDTSSCCVRNAGIDIGKSILSGHFMQMVGAVLVGGTSESENSTLSTANQLVDIHPAGMKEASDSVQSKPSGHSTILEEGMGPRLALQPSTELACDASMHPGSFRVIRIFSSDRYLPMMNKTQIKDLWYDPTQIRQTATAPKGVRGYCVSSTSAVPYSTESNAIPKLWFNVSPLLNGRTIGISSTSALVSRSQCHNVTTYWDSASDPLTKHNV